MELIATSTVGSGGASSIDFTSIPQTYTDLLLVFSGRHATTGTDSIIAQLNGTTSGYTFIYLGSTGSSVQNYTQSSLGFSNGMPFGNIGGTNYTANTFSSCQLYLPNYTAGSTAKVGSGEGGWENNDSSAAYFSFLAPKSTVTAAVTSISIKCSFYPTLVQYSSASLYGILKGSGGASVS